MVAIFSLQWSVTAFDSSSSTTKEEKRGFAMAKRCGGQAKNETTELAACVVCVVPRQQHRLARTIKTSLTHVYVRIDGSPQAEPQTDA
jgi:hypothetical protein